MAVRFEMIVRSTFPQVYKILDKRSARHYWLVSARSTKLGMQKRESFSSEKEALERARQIEAEVLKYGAQTKLPKEKLVQADAYEKLTKALAPFGKIPEDAVSHYLQFLGQEILRRAKPPLRELVDKWTKFKKTDTTLSQRTVTEIQFYSRFIMQTWGGMKVDEPKKNDIDLIIRALKVANNTRRKYLRYIRMFFSWVQDENLLQSNPTDGINYKPDDFNADFYSVETTSKLLRHVATEEKDLIGFYAILTFAGLRPSEGTRIQWEDYGWKTSELYVRRGKTNARHVVLEPVAMAWMKWHRDNTPQGSPFLNLTSLVNREKKVRRAVMNDKWIQDGLRHGFGTYYKAKTKDISKVADYMGNSAGVVKRHYARSIPAEECTQFWGLTPDVVLNIAPPKTSLDATGLPSAGVGASA